MLDKQQLRQHYLGLLKTQSIADRAKKSQLIVQRLRTEPAYSLAKTIFTYNANPEEVDTAFLIRWALEDGKTVAAPHLYNQKITPKKISGLDRLTPGPYNIMQPDSDAETLKATELDLVIVPGLAFTEEGIRLGRGGGHFDRWLASLPPTTPIIGLAFDFQLAEELPKEPHDISVSLVITN